MQMDLEGSANVAERLTVEEVSQLQSGSVSRPISQTISSHANQKKQHLLDRQESWSEKNKWETGAAATPRHTVTKGKNKGFDSSSSSSKDDVLSDVGSSVASNRAKELRNANMRK